MNWLTQNWPWIAGLLIAIGTAVTLIANRFRDPDNDPATPPPKWVQWALAIADVLSFVATKGKAGVAGPLNLPGLPSFEKGSDKPLQILAIIAAGSLWAACVAPMVAYYKGTASTADAAATCYKIVDKYDDTEMTKISNMFQSGDEMAARIELHEWLDRYQKARKVCDGIAGAAAEALAAAPLVEAATDKEKRIEVWLAKAARVASEAVAALKELGIVQEAK